MPKLPNFIIIGAPKCGTTALYHNLNLHPDIYMARMNNWPYIEIYFFNKRASWNRGIEWYKNLFPDDKICGEKTPTYYLSYKAMSKIKRFVSNVKLIFCIRNPVERAYSHYKSLNLNCSLSEAIEVNPHIIEAGFYNKYMINNVYPLFNYNKILTIFQEKMYDSTKTQMQKVYRFLGVNPFIGNFRRNKTKHNISDEEREILEDIYGEKLGT